MAAVLAPDEFESRLRQFIYDRSEETRAVRVGNKEVSDQVAIVARYADLFMREQLDALDADRGTRDPDAVERLHRLRRACASGILLSELAPLQDALENAELAARARPSLFALQWHG